MRRGLTCGGPYIECNRLLVLKNSIARKWSENFASGCPTNDVLVFLDIFYPPNFRCFEEWSFSAATPDNDSETSLDSSVCPLLYGLTGNFYDAKCVFSNEAPNRWRERSQTPKLPKVRTKRVVYECQV